jgi:hypothetical protein
MIQNADADDAENCITKRWDNEVTMTHVFVVHVGMNEFFFDWKRSRRCSGVFSLLVSDCSDWYHSTRAYHTETRLPPLVFLVLHLQVPEKIGSHWHHVTILMRDIRFLRS